MRLKIILLSVVTVPFLLSGCGGDNANAYDGTWAAVYPALSSPSSVTDAKTVYCSNPPVTLTIKDSVGSGQFNATCTTTIITKSTDPVTGTVTTTSTTYPDEVTYANFSIIIAPKANEKDVINAIVNGVTFTGQCISTIACSAVSSNGDTVSMTR
jgi:hypothetical protein